MYRAISDTKAKFIRYHQAYALVVLSFRNKILFKDYFQKIVLFNIKNISLHKIDLLIFGLPMIILNLNY